MTTGRKSERKIRGPALICSHECSSTHSLYNNALRTQDFPGGVVDKNPPANAGDMGSIPELRRFHMFARELSLFATTTEA